MNLRIKIALATLALSTAAMAQSDGPFQVRYASNLGVAGYESVVNFTNTGANNANEICVNTYTFSPDEQEISCCSCKVTRNALWSLQVNKDLINNTLTPGVENSVVIKLLATQAPSGSLQRGESWRRRSGLGRVGTTFIAETEPMVTTMAPRRRSPIRPSALRSRP